MISDSFLTYNLSKYGQCVLECLIYKAKEYLGRLLIQRNM